MTRKFSMILLLATVFASVLAQAPQPTTANTIDVKRCMDRLHSQLDTDSASIAVSRDMLSTIELFECVGDLNIDIEIRNDSILSADDARLIYLWYNYNYRFFADSTITQFFDILSDYKSRPETGQLTYGGRWIHEDIMRNLRKLQFDFFFRKYDCASTMNHLTTKVIPDEINPFVAPRNLGWAKAEDNSIVVDTLNIEINFAEYDQILSNLTVDSFIPEQRAIEIASLIECLRSITDCPVFLRGLPSIFSTSVSGYGNLAYDSRLQYSNSRRASNEALQLFNTWYKANRTFITESMLKRYAQYMWIMSHCYEPLVEIGNDEGYLISQALEILKPLRIEFFRNKYIQR